MMHVFEDQLAMALLDLMTRMNSPRQDELLLKEAGVAIDRALFPLLARIGARGHISMVELAEQVDKDPSTVSRQVARLETLGLVTRQAGTGDQRVREAIITSQGQDYIVHITTARRRLLKALLAEWSEDDRHNLPRLISKLAEGMKAAETAFVATTARGGD